MDPAAGSGDCRLLALPAELFVATGPRLLANAQAVARLAGASRRTKAGLSDADGKLRVGSIVTHRLRSVVDGLARVSLPDLEILRVDLSLESRECLRHGEVEDAIKALGCCMLGAASLRVLALRLASFDVSMGRMRLSGASWEALVLGLDALAQYRRLHSLELSSITIKDSHATKIVGQLEAAGEPQHVSRAHILPVDPSKAEWEQVSPGRKLRRAASSPTPGSGTAAAAATRGVGRGPSTFLVALSRLSSLEELALTYDEIFGSTAQLLPSALCGLEKLRRLDLTRNHISKQVMRALREGMPPRVELHGDDQQTFFFY